MNTDSRKWIQGMSLVLVVALIWIVASYVVQSVEEDGLAPFVLTYICNSLFIVLIPLVEGPRWLRRVLGTANLPRAPSSEANSVRDGSKKMRKADSLVDMVKALAERSPSLSQWLASSPSSTNLEEGALLHINEDEQGSTGSSESGGGYTRARMMLMALTICPFWFAAQFTFNWSLSKTSVSSNTILSSTSSIFTFLLSLAFLGERFTIVKLVSIFLCLAGTAVVALADKKNHPDDGYDTIYGDLLCLLSAAFYGIYTSLIRGLSPIEGGKAEMVDGAKAADSGEEEHAAPGSAASNSSSEGFSTALLFGYIGVFNLLLLFPVGVLIQMSKLENLKWPTLHQWGLVIGKGLFDNVLSDYLWARAVLLTTTTAATTGLQIQVPIAIAVDSMSAGQWPDWMHLSGALLVLAGFVGINSNFAVSFLWFGRKASAVENKETEEGISDRL